VPIGDRKAFAVKRLNGTANTKIDNINSISEVQIDRLAGFEIESHGHHKKEGQKLIVYQTMLFPAKGGYILMTGLVGEEEADVYLPKFRAMARTYQSKPPSAK
jgi:hypothetical protein